MTGCGARSTSLWVHRNLFWDRNKREKLAWLRHVKRHISLFKTILQDTLDGRWCHGQQRKCWMDNIKKWTSLPMPELLTRASYRKKKKKNCKRISAELPLMSLQWPNQSRGWSKLNWCIPSTTVNTGLHFLHCKKKTKKNRKTNKNLTTMIRPSAVTIETVSVQKVKDCS